jgi:DNA-binding Lrp family transcriptional regulator
VAAAGFSDSRLDPSLVATWTSTAQASRSARHSSNQHNEAWLQAFATAVQAIHEIIEVWRMSGDMDYLLRVVVRDIQGYDQVYMRSIRSCELFDVSSSFAMERIKYSTALPLPVDFPGEAGGDKAA